MKTSRFAPFAIRANKRAVWLLLTWTTLMLACELLVLLDGFGALVWVAWLLRLIGLLIVLAFALDYLWLFLAYRHMGQMSVTRHADNNLSVYEYANVSLGLYHEYLPSFCHALSFSVMDYYPSITQTDQLPVTVSGHQLADDNPHDDDLQGLTISYPLYANERGLAVFGGVDWLISTPLGLLAKFYHTPKADVQGVADVRILVNFKALVQGNLLAVSKRTNTGGIIKKRRKGQGQDFHQIRSYTEGDSIRHIHWKATARQQRLMTKEYQDEADQEILFLLDCGQNMRHTRFVPDDKLANLEPWQVSNGDNAERVSHLDKALNAMLLLAEVANRQADATGFISFSGEINKTAMPKKGAKVISYLLNQTFDLQASMHAPDYMSATRQALSLQKRRSLVILITNIRTANTDEIMGALQLLTQKHRVILVNLYESDLKHYLQNTPQSIQDALTYHSIKSYLDTQKQINASLAQSTGTLVISSTPEELPQKLLDGYWQVKRFGAV